jgi:hypothetical protein
MGWGGGGIGNVFATIQYVCMLHKVPSFGGFGLVDKTRLILS